MHRRSKLVQLIVCSIASAACGTNGGVNGDASTDSDSAADASMCGAPHTLTCTYGYAYTTVPGWSTASTATVSIGMACGDAGQVGGIQAWLQTQAAFTVERWDITLSGSATTMCEPNACGPYANSTANSYSCGLGFALTAGFDVCTPGITPGTLLVHWAFHGHWDDGTLWDRTCDATVTVQD